MNAWRMFSLTALPSCRLTSIAIVVGCCCLFIYMPIQYLIPAFHCLPKISQPSNPLLVFYAFEQIRATNTRTNPANIWYRCSCEIAVYCFHSFAHFKSCAVRLFRPISRSNILKEIPSFPSSNCYPLFSTIMALFVFNSKVIFGNLCRISGMK